MEENWFRIIIYAIIIFAIVVVGLGVDYLNVQLCNSKLASLQYLQPTQQAQLLATMPSSCG